ncbi:MAG: TonB-dependent receptor [Deltaproteobacteria bacterium]|nr:TonB-dependent receptor [Deltaproteobacteria bacterium]
MMRRLFAEFFTLGLGIVFIFTDVSTLKAQGSDEFTLEEITVTAQKREENQQKVPITMDVISGEEMKELGNSDLDEMILRASNVFINEAGDGLRVSIRGISSTETHRGDLYTISNSMPVVAVNTDGVFTAGRKSGANMFDLERVEVLMGPQSTIYASNSPGGIVNVVTGSPKIDQYDMSGKVEFGNYRNMQTEGMLNVPIGSRIAIRTSFMTSSRGPYMSNGSDDDNTKAVRIKTMFKPTDKFSITLSGQYLLDQGMGIGRIDMFKDQDDVDDPWDNSEDDAPVPRKRTVDDFNIQFDWDLGIGTLTILPAYSRMEEKATMTMTSMFTGEEYTNFMDNRQTEKGAEARITSSEDFSFKWIFGGNIYRFKQQGIGITVGTPYWNGTHNEIRSWALYGNVTYPVTDRFRVTGGLRYSDDWNEGHFGGVDAGRGANDRLSFLYYDGFDHKIGFEYDLGENSMLYADNSTGYRVGSMGGAESEPETLMSYTIGAKNRFFGNKLQLNWSAYHYMYENYPAENHMDDPVTGLKDDGGETQGNKLMIGSDLQADMILSANDRVSLQVSWVHAEFDDMVFEYYSPNLPDLVYSGKEPTFTPEWTVTANYDHIFNLPNDSTLTGHFDIRYQTAQLISFMEEASVMIGGPPPIVMDFRGYRDQEAYHLSNLALTYAHPDGKWTLAGYVKNVENYAVKRNLMFAEMMIGPPRTYGLVLSVKY